MDILIFAAIAAFIFYKLNKELGKIDEGEKKIIEEKIAQKRQKVAEIQDKIKQIDNMIVVNSTKTAEVTEAVTAKLDEFSKQNFTNILQKCKINAEFFVNGAKSAFEMVIKAFASGDIDTLKFLLSPKIYEGFANAVAQRKAAEQTLVTNLIAIETPEIISATLADKVATVTVKFVSKQINYLTNKEGAIIQGGKDEIITLTDVWTFKKDVTDPNPNWAVVSTNSN